MSDNSTKIRVPFFRIRLGDEEIEAVENVLRSGWLTTGDQAVNFEDEFARAVGVGVSGVAVNSNTAGLHLALEALGVGPGDEVIVPVLTFTATAEVVRYLGATPVFADIDEKTLCLSVDTIEGKITPQTRVIMPVHFGGLACDVTAIAQCATRYGIAVVEDAAHAFPCTHRGVQVGGHGTSAAVFSFYANKTITTGEGGMIVSADAKIIERTRIMRLHGIDRDVFRRHTDKPELWRYDIIAPGYKYNLTDVAAAIGRAQLRKAHQLRNARAEIAAKYNRAFSQLPVILPHKAFSDDIHAWHLYILQVEDGGPVTRDGLMEVLDTFGIGYSVHYTPLHQMSYWRKTYSLLDRDFPVATRYARRCISLPLYPSMTEEESNNVIEAVVSAFA